MKRLVPIAPYGYQIAGSTLVPEAREQAVIAIVRDGRARGISLAKLAVELQARGYTTRAGNPFNDTAVFTIAKAIEEERSAS